MDCFGEAEAQERENDGPWITSRLKKGSLYLTSGSAPYEFRWRTITAEPFEVLLVLLSLTLFNEALEDVFGPDAPNARLFRKETGLSPSDYRRQR